MTYEQIQNAIIKGLNSNIRKSAGKSIQIGAGTYAGVEVTAVGTISFASNQEKKSFDIEEYDTQLNIEGTFQNCYINNEQVKSYGLSLYDIIDYVATFGGYISVGDGYIREFEKATDLDKIEEEVA